MNEENVLSMYLRLITEYDYLDYTEEELMEDFKEVLAMAVVMVQLQGIFENNNYDMDFGFDKELSVKEAYLLANAAVLVWLEPKVKSAEMLAAQLTSTDFTQFSNANRLNACMKLYHQCEARLNNLILDYDRTMKLAELREEL